MIIGDTHLSAGNRWTNGFTLAELIIVIAVLSILMAIALPSFQSQIRKGRRTDAIDALTAVQLAQEKYRAGNTSYASLATLGFANPYPSTDGYYSVTVTSPTSTGYTATAAAVSGKSQASDTGCTSIVLTVAAGSISPTPTTCWNR